MEFRLVDIHISSSSGRHSTRAIVLKLLVSCLLASGILPLVENAEGIFHDAHSRNDRAGYSGRAAPEYAFRMESDFRRLGAFSRQQSAGMLCDGRRQEGRRNRSYDFLRESISMNCYGLVDPEYRKQGIGTQLLNKTIEHLDHSNISTIKLDATPLGKPLYTKLGFISEFEIERWILKRPPGTISTIPSTPPAPLTDDQQQEIFTLDRKCFGADRSFLLRSLCDQAPEFALTAWQNGVPPCFAFGRHGLFADHLGPCMATSRVAAEKLLSEFLARSSRETLIVDCIKSNPGVVESLAAIGFVPSRPLTRMVRGPNAYPGRPDSLWAILGPEFG